jgi:soluble P-type ATPase
MLVDNNKGIFDFKGFVPERVKQLIKLLQDSKVQAFLNQLDDSEQLSRLAEMVR